MPLKSSTDMDNFINGSHKINLTYWSYHQIDQRLKWDFDSAWTKQSSSSQDRPDRGSDLQTTNCINFWSGSGFICQQQETGRQDVINHNISSRKPQHLLLPSPECQPSSGEALIVSVCGKTKIKYF